MGRERADVIFFAGTVPQPEIRVYVFLGKSWPICNRDHHAVIDMQAQSPFGEQVNSHHPINSNDFLQLSPSETKQHRNTWCFFPLPSSPWVRKISCYNLLPGCSPLDTRKNHEKGKVFLRLQSPQKYGFYKYWRLWGFPWCLYSLR